MALTIQRAPDELQDARQAAALGIDQPAGWWPTAPRLKSYEAAGFSHLQVRMPASELLADPSLVDGHAGALAGWPPSAARCAADSAARGGSA